MPQAKALSQRLYCAACTRPQRACICECVRPVSSALEVLVLQHPDEVNHAKGSARLLHLCLPNSRIMAGEVFDETLLKQWLSAGDKQAVLLYPGAENAKLAAKKASELRLVMIDATWQNSRRLLRLNPALQALPRVAFTHPAPTRYSAIRVAHAPHQLSTIEAAAAMLAKLEHGLDAQPLMAAFDAFIALQQSFLPPIRRVRHAERALKALPPT